jgi:chromosome segregation ATPase
VIPSVSFGQSLAEAAAKEKARRKALEESNKKPAKSYSDADLGNAKGTNASFPSGSEATAATDAAATKDGAATPGGKKEKTDDEKLAEASAAWHKNLDAANKDAASYRDQIAKIQTDLNDTSGGFYGARRATMQTQLDDAKKKLADAEAKVAELEDQGRRSGYR